jgi:hypothetical protein
MESRHGGHSDAQPPSFELGKVDQTIAVGIDPEEFRPALLAG